MNYEEIVQPQEFCVENIFKGTEYVVPIYQRNYAWETKEIEQLLNDINDVPKEKNVRYYLGSLIVNQLGANVFEVIDGQQRLTTLYLLLSFLNNNSVTEYSLRFEAREKSNKTLHDIYSIKNTTSKLEKEHWYSEEIIEGYSIITKYFEGKGQDFIDGFKNKLGKITIIRTQVPKGIDLNHYFEMMNTRGEQLELHEIVKAKIIGAIKTGETITETDKKDKMIAATIWDACAQMDKYVQMCFNVDIRKKLFSENNWDTFLCASFDDIRRIFDDKEYKGETRFFLRDKLKNPEKGNNVTGGKDEEENDRFESIITFPNFILQVNEAMNDAKTDNVTKTDDDTGLDDKRIIEIMEDNWSSKEKALKFIYLLLKYKYIFDRYIIKREYVGNYKVDGKWSLKRLEMYTDNRGQKPSYRATLGSIGATGEIEDNETNVNNQLRLLQSCLRITYTSPKTMHWIAKVIRAVKDDEDGTNIIQLLEEYCCDKVIKADYKNRTGFAIDRIVFSYLDYILCRDNAKEFKDFQFQFRTSIEHFFPQHPINRDNAVAEENRDSFGNLALITVSANSKFSNMLPVHKVEQYENVIEQSPKLMMMKKLLDNNNRVWNNNMVEKHNNEMLALLDDEVKKSD